MVWTRKSTLLNDFFLQSKFKRLDHELPCFLHLVTAKHEGWSLRDVLRGLPPMSNLLESSSTQSQPDPASAGQLSHGRGAWVGSEHGAGGVSPAPFRTGVCLLKEKISMAGIN